MLMLRKGGDFADGQIRKYLAVSLLCLGLALTIVFAKPYIDLNFGGFLVATSANVLFKATFRRWCNWLVGKRGEEAVAQALKALSNDYALLNDLRLPESRGNLDHVLIGSNGLFAIETKNYSGFVKCDGDRWFVGRRAIHSLSKQAKRNSMAIRASLASLYAEKGVRVPYVTPVLVFVDRRARLKLFQPTIPVLRLDELVDFVRNHRAVVTMSNTQKHAIVRHLQSLQDPSGEASMAKRSSSLLTGSR